jgi:hypothetical protein
MDDAAGRCRGDNRCGLPGVTVQGADLKALRRQLQRLVEQRCQEFNLPAPAVSSLVRVLPDDDYKAWLAVPGMYGGFSFWTEKGHGQLTMTVESWSRVVEGSGHRHLVTASGFVLVEDQIC